MVQVQRRPASNGVRRLLLPLTVVLTACASLTAAEGLAIPAFPGVLPRPKDYRENGPPRLLVRSGGSIRVQTFGKHISLKTGGGELVEALKRLGASADVSDQGARIRIGVTAEWPGSTGHLPDPPQGRPEAYALSVTTAETGETTVAIRSSDAMGAYYGIQTLIQLLDRAPEGVTVRQVEVYDWPTFTLRMFKGQCWYYRDNLMFARWAPQFKWNTFGSCYTDSPDWRDVSESYRAMIAELCRIGNESGTIRVMQLGNPYMLKEKAIRASSESDIETLATFFEPSLSRGSRILMLCLDDFAFLPKEDQAEFKNLAGANASIVTRFAERIRSTHPGTRILLCPPPYWLAANKSKAYEWAHEYLRDLCANIPREVSIVWTGREVTTLCHEAADIEAYQNLIGAERHLFLWDNTLKMPAGWGNVFRMNAFLAACDHVATSAWPGMATFTRGEAVINTYGPAEIYKVPLMTAADYLWNPEQYDSQDAMRRALYWFDQNRVVGVMVSRWVDQLHQTLCTKRLEFLKTPATTGLTEIKNLTSLYQAEFDRIASATTNQALLETLRPYLLRHTEALPILAEIRDAWNAREASPSAARQKLIQAKGAFENLAKTLDKGDLATDRHGLVRQELESQTGKAVDALISTVTASSAAPASPR